MSNLKYTSIVIRVANFVGSLGDVWIFTPKINLLDLYGDFEAKSILTFEPKIKIKEILDELKNTKIFEFSRQKSTKDVFVVFSDLNKNI